MTAHLHVLVTRRTWRCVRPRPAERACFWLPAERLREELLVEEEGRGLRLVGEPVVYRVALALERGALRGRGLLLGHVLRDGRHWVVDGRRFSRRADAVALVVGSCVDTTTGESPSAYHAHRWASQGWIPGLAAGPAVFVGLGRCCVFDAPPTLCERRAGVFRRTVAKRGKRLVWR